jgi:hypothetical protein
MMAVKANVQLSGEGRQLVLMSVRVGKPLNPCPQGSQMVQVFVIKSPGWLFGPRQFIAAD